MYVSASCAAFLTDVMNDDDACEAASLIAAYGHRRSFSDVRVLTFFLVYVNAPAAARGICNSTNVTVCM